MNQFNDYFGNFQTISNSDISDVSNVEQTSDDAKITVTLPGIPKELITLQCSEDKLTVSIVAYKGKKSQKYSWLFSPKVFDRDAISAKLEMGQLIITLPKLENAKPKIIDIS